MAPEHKRLARYPTMALDGHMRYAVRLVARDPAHLLFMVPNALLPEGLKVMEHWGFKKYKRQPDWVLKSARMVPGPQGASVSIFANVTEVLLLALRGQERRETLAARGAITRETS